MRAKYFPLLILFWLALLPVFGAGYSGGGGGGVAVDDANTWTGNQTFTDGTLKLDEAGAGTETLTLSAVAQSGNVTLNLPAITTGDTVTTLGTAQTFGGIKTFSNAPVLTSATLTANGDTITIQDLGNANIVQSEGAQTINGVKTLGSAPIFNSLTARGVLVLDASKVATTIAPGSSGNVLKSNGTSWTSAAASGADTTAANTWTGVQTFNHQRFALRDTANNHSITVEAAGDESAARALQIPKLGGDGVLGVTMASTASAISTSANTTETDGASATIDIDALQFFNSVRWVVVDFYGRTAANANNKTVKVYFDGTEAYSTGAVAANNKPWHLQMTIMSTGSLNEQRVFVNGDFNGVLVPSTVTTNTASGSAVIKVTMTNGTANAGDITSDGMNLRVH